MDTPIQIGPDAHVTVAYTLTEIGESGAPVPEGFSRGLPEEPVTLSYVHGYGQVLPALEKALAGKEKGIHLTVSADPADAFGAHEADGVIEIEKDGLEGSEDLTVGEEVVASGPDGDFLMRVLEVRDTSVVVDTNHPLAGKRVRFEIDIVEVRAATDVEIEEAQQAAMAEDDDACGCGHDHGDDHDHDHDHDHEQHADEEPGHGPN